MNENYWPTFYKNREQQGPSDFAGFCHPRIKRGAKILDVGAGDGRDASLLKTRGDVTMVEPNNDLREIAQEINGQFYNTTFEDFLGKYDWAIDNLVIYARWFLHAVPEDIEDKLLKFAQDQNATIMAEFRVHGDNPDSTHERRLIDPSILAKKFLEREFIINHLSIGYNYSKHGDDNPYLGRIIAERPRR